MPCTSNTRHSSCKLCLQMEGAHELQPFLWPAFCQLFHNAPRQRMCHSGLLPVGADAMPAHVIQCWTGGSAAEAQLSISAWEN